MGVTLVMSEKSPLLPVGAPKSRDAQQQAWSARNVSWVVGLSVGLSTAVALGVVSLLRGGDMFAVGRDFDVNGMSSPQAEDGQACSLVDISHGLTWQAEGEATGVRLGCDGPSQVYIPRKGRKPEYASFQCTSESYNDYLWKMTVSTPNCCSLNIPSVAEQPPFPAGHKVLMVGNSFVMQLAFALLDRYDAALTSVKTGTDTLQWDVDCECLSGSKDNSRCRQEARRAFFDKPDDEVKPGDGFQNGMAGLPDKTIKAVFSNGAELYVMTNHPMMQTPVFGIDAVASTFGLETTDFDVILANEGNGMRFAGVLCKDHGAEHGGIFRKEIEDVYGIQYSKPLKEVVQTSEKGAVNAVHGQMMLSHTYDTLVRTGFKGQLVVTPAGSGDVIDQLRQYLPVEAFGSNNSPFPVKATPAALSFAKPGKFPFVKSPRAGSTCDCNVVDWQSQCPASELGSHVGEDMCNAGKGSHPCEPGLPDVAAQLFLHVMYTAPEHMRMESALAAGAQADIGANRGDRVHVATGDRAAAMTE